MRVSLIGYGGPVYPLLLNLIDSVPFIKGPYVDRGYTNFEVLCVGGAGGFGQGINLGIIPSSADWDGLRPFGGAGGGGGVHRMSGSLDILPSSCDVTVGSAGTDPVSAREYPETISDLDLSTGGDGGTSSFNTDLCIASGGVGGGPVVYDSSHSWIKGGIGGQGGIGGSDTPGGGGAGGAGEYWDVAAIPGVDGTWDGTIGAGGGGGGGGIGLYFDGYPFSGNKGRKKGSSGGRGAYNASNISQHGPGGLALFPPKKDSFQSDMIDVGIMPGIDTFAPGGGGGAKATSLNSLLVAYGTRANRASGDGIVLLRLVKA